MPSSVLFREGGSYLIPHDLEVKELELTVDR
jgi:hypothetical protein